MVTIQRVLNITQTSSLTVLLPLLLFRLLLLLRYAPTIFFARGFPTPFLVIRHLPKRSLHQTITTASVFDFNTNADDRKLESSTSSVPTEFVGKHKWLGGAVDPTDGSIYGVPSHSRDVIRLFDPSRVPSNKSNNKGENEYRYQRIALPSTVARGKYKWLRGIVCDGYLYGIPAWSTHGVLRVDLSRVEDERLGRITEDWSIVNGMVEDKPEDVDADGIVTVLPLPPPPLWRSTNNHKEEESHNEESPARWQWHGAALNHNRTAIYCIPSNAFDVLKIDLATGTTSYLEVPRNRTPKNQTNKWYGGILGRDGCVYGIPYAASGVLKINTNTDTVTILGNFGVKQYNWHGGVFSPTSGCIYAFPSHHPCVLRVDTNPSNHYDNNDDGDDDDSKELRNKDDPLSLLPIHRPEYDTDEVTRYKWLGGSLGADGNVYGMPSDASSVLRIDTKTDTATTFGVVGGIGVKNKWQGGVLARDGRLYAIPSNASNILCIDTAVAVGENPVKSWRDVVSLIGDLPSSKDKWQGGFLGNEGAIYCIPENSNSIMKVTPNGTASTIGFL